MGASPSRAVTSGAAAVAVAVVAVAALVASAVAPASARPERRRAPRGAAFYDPPDTISGRPGDVVWARSIDAPEGARAWRVLYVSQGVRGEKVGVSGVIVAPTGSAPAGGRPVVTWAHGTTGVADKCAPSHAAGAASAIPNVGALLDAGYVVAATDYEGLGTPGRHPYLVGTSEGRSVLDAARAARRLPGTGAGSDVIVYGHSQGGHAALFAGQLAADYAPDLDVRGVVAAAPLTNARLMLPVALGVPDAIGLVVLAGAGYGAAYPDLDPDSLLTPAAAAESDAIVDGECAVKVVEHYTRRPADVFARNPLDVPPWPDRLQENSAGNEPTTAPILVVHGEHDQLIPVVMSRLFLPTACAQGDSIALRTYDADHGSVITASRDDALTWMADRLAGRPATSAC